MSDAYPVPTCFVTLYGNPASQAVLSSLNVLLAQPPLAKSSYSCITQTDPDLLLQSLSRELTVALFDVPEGIKSYKPLHLTQQDKNRPAWAGQLFWSVAINTHAKPKIIRNCAQQVAAWFRHGIKQAVPGQRYPWGPVPVSERNIVLQRLVRQSLT